MTSNGAPPEAIHNVELESALLGALLVNNHAFQHIGGLRPDHFYEPVHRLLFEGAQTLVAAGKPANPLTLRTMLPADMQIAGITAPQYLAGLAAAATSVINAGDYADSIRALAKIRDADAILDDLRRFDYRHLFPGDALREAFHRLDMLRLDQPNQHAAETAGASSNRFLTWMSGVMSGTVSDLGVPSGLVDFDKMTGGLKAADLIIMAGRPGMGKTTLAAGIGRNVSRGGTGVGMFSLEMGENPLMARVHCDEAFGDGTHRDVITYNQALNPRRFLNFDQGERLLDAGRRIEQMPLMFDFSSSLTVGEIAAKSRGMALTLERKFQTRLGLIIVDYIKFVQSSDRYAGNKTYEIGEISRGLKQLAKDLNVPVILLAQLNREVEKREDKMPILSDLRESGDLEADADTVVLLFREAYYLQTNPKTFQDPVLQTRLVDCMHKLLLLVPKNRHGPTGNVEVFCHMGASAVRNIAREGQEEMSIT